MCGVLGAIAWTILLVLWDAIFCHCCFPSTLDSSADTSLHTPEPRLTLGLGHTVQCKKAHIQLASSVRRKDQPWAPNNVITRKERKWWQHCILNTILFCSFTNSYSSISYKYCEAGQTTGISRLKSLILSSSNYEIQNTFVVSPMKIFCLGGVLLFFFLN